jgi:hypothetical protein
MSPTAVTLGASVGRVKCPATRGASKETAGTDSSKKKKQHQSTLFSDGDEVLRGLNKAHKGKCLLIPAKVLYSGRVPIGQEDDLFQYSVLMKRQAGRVTMQKMQRRLHLLIR